MQLIWVLGKSLLFAPSLPRNKASFGKKKNLPAKLGMRTNLSCACGKWRIALGFACRMATCKWEEMPNKHQIFGCCIAASGVLSSNELYNFLLAISLSLSLSPLYHTLIRVWCKWDRHVGGGWSSDFFSLVCQISPKCGKIRIYEMKKKIPKTLRK
jgi:hypothetical protein